MNWSWDHFFRYLTSPFLLEGVINTVWLAIVAMIIGVSLGVVLAFMRMSKSRILRFVSGVYIWLWRGTPLLVQLVIIYTGLPQLGIRLGVIESAILALSLHEGAYFAEIARSGIMSVGKGQEDASRALGMTWWQRMKIVIIPQATRIIIPPLGNQFNLMLKTTSLASVISMEELLRHAQQLAQIEFRVLEVYFCAAIWYLFLTTVWGQVQIRLEAHYDRPFGPAGGDDRSTRQKVLDKFRGPAATQA
ncbi:amino acid ABC transporter permease [Acuticoccus sp. MNP-M23]|uniref:amino acid ABC transporter permease n=1 Tax=Acuticoccus sp. MNP-M23 TaxID=3072793 RepID=UPI0028157DE2|nr:amino acid ABC transporter permease [Acuticoccus sp. MNP-M23]WMS42920.1 amino acid ABC transporter permease [Acuticoccus sp. MNP-M23]